jgi:galactokinase/mevalonate kinase-like predicted kinase
MHTFPMNKLLSLPPEMSGYCNTHPAYLPGWFIASDPPGAKLGSGGGTAYLLAQAWNAHHSNDTFENWIISSQNLLLHGGGESRRLPAYAPIGKPLIPLPIVQERSSQRTDRLLINEQESVYESLFGAAPSSAKVMIASGDVLLRHSPSLPSFPAVDVLALGMKTEPKVPHGFGVFFSIGDDKEQITFFLQKPSIASIGDYSDSHRFLIDTGVWILSARAVSVLMKKCGWIADEQKFIGGRPAPYDLYSTFGPALGTAPTETDPDIATLSCAVVELPDPKFLHFGTTRQLIESVGEITTAKRQVVPHGNGRTNGRFIINAACDASLDTINTVWIEGANIPASWRLSGGNVLTGISGNDEELELPDGMCLDVVPVSGGAYCLRWYGIDDSFSGTLDEPTTTWCNGPASAWFAARCIDLKTAGIESGVDIYDAPLFPVLSNDDLTSSFITWLTAFEPRDTSEFTKRWLGFERLSARDLRTRIDCERYIGDRRKMAQRYVHEWYTTNSTQAIASLDLDTTAQLFAEGVELIPEGRINSEADPLTAASEAMFRATIIRHRGGDGSVEETRAFHVLQEGILASLNQRLSAPTCGVHPDQIVWARSPIRLDLSGGWSDTPPYCLRYGGRVTNIAVDLNGQPPIQVFVRLSQDPVVSIKSIDLGLSVRIVTYEELDTFATPGSGFAIAKAALAIAGFLPKFHSGEKFESLEKQLQSFGGGIEIITLAAIPQGSGLGTSSILSATVLGALNTFCRLKWNSQQIISATLALEQLLTTGGGWQDQAGGILRGVKLLETVPGLRQDIRVRWLPEFLFRDPESSHHMLLYYTGITRMAKGILQDIVRNMFLGAGEQLSVLHDIADTAVSTADAIQQNDLAGLAHGVARSWDLNRKLDAGTDPPVVQALLDPIKDYVAGMKLLGAGGGGYLFIIAKDIEAAVHIRQLLIENPPNAQARFVTMTPSVTGMDVTMS